MEGREGGWEEELRGRKREEGERKVRGRERVRAEGEGRRENDREG